MDDRYEVRDAQYLLSVLADEGLVEPTKIGATGVSYGGGISIALGALRNREMEPKTARWSRGKAPKARQWKSLPRCRSGPGRHLLRAGAERSQPRLRHQLAVPGPDAANCPIGVMKFSCSRRPLQSGR